MEKEILKINKKNSGKKVSNYGGWQSFNFYNVEKPFVDLFDEIDKIILNIKNKLEITDPIKFQNYWLNINTLVMLVKIEKIILNNMETLVQLIIQQH